MYPYALIDTQLLPAAVPGAAFATRGFRYGDGFFETIVFQNGAPRCWAQHRARIERGVAVLQLDVPPNFTALLLTLLTQLVEANDLAGGAARVRWQCWRAGGGLYAPESNAATWLATADALTTAEPATAGGRAGFAEAVRTAPSVLSFLKGPNAALYTLATLEKQDRGLDEVLLLSPAGHVAEASAAALLWVKDNVLFTPDAARTGAVVGVRLAYLLTRARADGWRVETGLFTPADLLAADAVAAVNVTSIRWLAAVEDRLFGLHPAQAALTALAD